MVVIDHGLTKVVQRSGLEDPARYVAQLLSPEGTAKFLKGPIAELTPPTGHPYSLI
jgi:hypothetical protein